ncbi:MAG: hypothetical protein ACLSH6_04580 [Limosilactobacillus pontis]
MQKRQLSLIMACVATGLAIVLLAVLMIPGRGVHYVSSSVLQRHFYLHSGWYYDGRDWAFVQGGHKVTGTRQINGVAYHFDRDGKQILPYRVNYQYQLTTGQGTNQPATPNTLSCMMLVVVLMGSRRPVSCSGRQIVTRPTRTLWSVMVGRSTR